jgi:hypothetical protein
MRAEVDLAVEARLSQTRSAAEVRSRDRSQSSEGRGCSRERSSSHDRDDSEANDSAAGHHLVRNGLLSSDRTGLHMPSAHPPTRPRQA